MISTRKCFLLLLFLAGWLLAGSAPTEEKPNIIIILTDDMGYGDISCFGGRLAPTPNIDRLAKSGMKVTSYYSAAPICSPSRAGLLSGMHPGRWNFSTYLDNRKHNRNAEQADYLDPAAPTMARFFKAAGYATGHFGKWHLGGGRDVTNAPGFEQYGFDEHASTYESPAPDPMITAANWIWSDKDSIKRWDRTQYFVDKALDFMRRHKGQPCLVNLWPDDVHTPWVPRQGSAFKGRFPMNPEEEEAFKQVLKTYDAQIGRLLDGLQRMGMDKNTIIIFTSDNGPLPSFRGSRTGGLRGSKLSLYEGGINMPFLISWPGHIPAGAVEETAPIHATDLLPSLSRMAGITLPDSYKGDGEDRSAVFFGKSSNRQQDMYWEYGRNDIAFKYPGGKDKSPRLAIRSGEWKLLMNHDGTDAQLFNIRQDRQETTDMAAAQPGIARELREKLSTWWQEMPRLKPAHDSLAVYDKRLSPQEMKQDLQLFRNIREKANSGLYRYRTRQQIDSIYNWALKEVSQPLVTTDFYKIILQLTDFEGSCHNYTEPPAPLMSFLKRQRAFFPYSLKYIEGRIIFNHQTDQIPAGARVLSINGVPDTTLMQSFYKYMTADGYTITEKLSGSVNNSYGIRYLLEYGVKDSFVVTFTPPYATQQQTVTLPAVTLEQREKNLAKRYSAPVDSVTDYTVQPKYSFRMINPSTGLLNLRIFTMATGKEDPAFEVYARFIDSVFRVLDSHSVENLIMDIRGNPGGSDPTFEQPMMYLTDQPFKENTLAYIIFDTVPYEAHFWGVSTAAKMGEQEIAEGKKMLKGYFPQFSNGRSFQDTVHNPVYHPKSPAFSGQLYLLVDERVGSAASHLASLVKAYGRNATIVGVETVGGYYGHNGHMPLVYQLPHSKIKTKFSIVYVVQDAPVKPDQPEGRGIIPHYEVWPTFEDFMKNRDTQMEYVLKLIKEKG